MDSTANTWLAILAIASLVETAVLITVLIVVARTALRTSEAISRLQRDQIEPLVGRVHSIADDMQDGIARLRMADDQIRDAVARGVAGTAGAVRNVRHGFWPVVGAVRGVAAAVTFLSRSRRRPLSFTDRSRQSAVGLHREGVPYVR